MLKDSNIIPLPPTAQVIADVIGRDATLVLANHCKYGHLYVPKQTMYDTHPIVRTIGRDLAQRLQREFPGELMPLPRCVFLRTRQRDAEIRAARLLGKKISVIAKEFQLSTKQVQLVIHPTLAERQRQRVRNRLLKQCMASLQN